MASGKLEGRLRICWVWVYACRSEAPQWQPHLPTVAAVTARRRPLLQQVLPWCWPRLLLHLLLLLVVFLLLLLLLLLLCCPRQQQQQQLVMPHVAGPAGLPSAECPTH